jgi:hypothetical protein
MKAKDRLTAEEWFERGNQFENSAHALMEGRHPEAAVTLGIPHVVLRAFGVEAFLKCLIELDGNTAPYDHNLLNLSQSPEPVQKTPHQAPTTSKTAMEGRIRPKSTGVE